MPAARTTRRASGRPARRWLRLALLCVLGGLSAWAVISYVRLPGEEEIRRLARAAPARSALMARRVEESREEGRPLRARQQWVSLSHISPVLQRAVVLGEDASFWVHGGVDWAEMRRAASSAFRKRELGRGASTITMQLARNLWLSTDRSIVRKLKEIVIARRLERHLKKARILELYLNYAEWGPGVFGAEAAARHHFFKSAAALTPGEAAVLASLLPAPRQWSPEAPTPRLRERVWRLADLLAADGRVAASAVRAQVEAIVGPRNGRSAAK